MRQFFKKLFTIILSLLLGCTIYISKNDIDKLNHAMNKKYNSLTLNISTVYRQERGNFPIIVERHYQYEIQAEKMLMKLQSKGEGINQSYTVFGFIDSNNEMNFYLQHDDDWIQIASLNLDISTSITRFNCAGCFVYKNRTFVGVTGAIFPFVESILKTFVENETTSNILEHQMNLTKYNVKLRLGNINTISIDMDGSFKKSSYAKYSYYTMSIDYNYSKLNLTRVKTPDYFVNNNIIK